jgi:tripartite-type tricarboxylate transporter receptor subunit TctC
MPRRRFAKGGTSMTRKILLALLCAALLGAGVSAPTSAEDYPSKPIHIVVPYPPGGSADLIARMLADKLAKSTGQTVVVENKGGASGMIGSDYVAHAPADGYTLLIAISDTHAINPAVSAKLPYDPQKDFAPISLLAIQPFVLVAGPSAKTSVLNELVRDAKARPGKITYASNGPGGLQHLAMELLSSTAGISLLHVPYKGAGPALSDVMGGHVDAIFISIQGAGGNLNSDKLRALAIAAPNRLAVAPDIPTFAESGYAFEVNQWYGLMAPRGTPPAILAMLNEHAKAAMAAPDVSGKLTSNGTEPIGSSGEEFAAFLARDIAKWANVAKANNIRTD